MNYARSALVLFQYGAHAEVFTDTALLIDVSVPQAANVTRQMNKAFSKTIAAEHGNQYTRMQHSVLLRADTIINEKQKAQEEDM